MAELTKFGPLTLRSDPHNAAPAVWLRGGAVDFYQVLALYELAVISEGIYARYLGGKTLGEGFEGMLRPAPGLAQLALAIADASTDRRLRGR